MPYLDVSAWRHANQRDDWRIFGFGGIEELSQAWPGAIENVIGQDTANGSSPTASRACNTA